MTPSGGVTVGLDLEGYRSVMADPDPTNPDLFQRAKQAQAQSKALREQVAAAAEAVAEVEEESARACIGPWLSRAVHWRKRPGSMPTELRTWRQRSEPRRSACARPTLTDGGAEGI